MIVGVASIEEGRLREVHDLEVRAVLRACGAVDGRGWILSRGWDESVIEPALEAAGHSSLDFDDCSCGGAKTEGGRLVH